MLNSSIANFFIIFSKTYNIFLYTFSDSLSLSLSPSLSLYALVCFSSHSSLHNGISLSSHLSLTTSSNPVLQLWKTPLKTEIKEIRIVHRRGSPLAWSFLSWVFGGWIVAKSLLVVWRGGETGEVRSAWYGGDFWVRFLGSWVCGGVVWWSASACSWVSGVICNNEISL